MANTVQDILRLLRDEDIQMVDFKMVDIHGQFRHVTIPAENFSEDMMTDGVGFDASNYGYAALLMAGLDGIQNKIDPHENGWGPYDMNLYSLSDEEKAKLHHLPTALDQALDALEADHEYLTRGGVFPEHLLKNFIAEKRKECVEIGKIPHPAEFDKYYNA